MRSLAFWVCMAAAIVGATHTLWPVLYSLLVLAVCLYVAVVWARFTEESKEIRAAKDVIIARADKQHQQFMQGDPAGIHGEYPPAF